MKKPLIILTGPTAVGKTAASIGLAKAIGGEIISADSMQVYRHMDIGSAKIRSKEMQGISHHLIDVLEPEEEFHVVKFQQMAKEALDGIYQRGHIPIVVGGTGFYIQALLYDISFEDNEEDHSYRKELEELAQEEGAEKLHQMLRQVDEKAAEKQSAGEESDHSVNTGAVVSPVENGIVSPARGASSGTGAGSDRTAEDYRNRLGEIENTIQNLENSGSANTTDAMREAVAYEYRLWDAELNQIYQAIMAVLPDEETDTLRGLERRWIRERDTAAKQAAERYKGGTMENVEYTASLANSTRDRAYELLDLYESYLPAE